MASELLIGVGGVFVLVAVAASAATAWWLTRTSTEQRRLRAVSQGSRIGLDNATVRLAADAADPSLARLSQLVRRSPKAMSRLQRRLTRAGYPSYSAVVIYALCELALPIVLALATIAFFGLGGGLLLAALLAVIGYVAPSLYISRCTKKRQKLISNGLPDALDLLTVCTEAGSGLDQAIVKASDEMQTTHPVLADELRLITTEIRAGKPRVEAFKNFAARTGVDDVRALVAMLGQTDRFGTSIADALRVQSDTSRTKRRQAAEERAGKVGVKLVFPLVLCLFPALYVVCLGPVAIRIYRVFVENPIN
jgi:tight adherence protein C